MNEVNVRYWRKQKEQLQGIPGKKRLPSGGRKALSPRMEEKLASWIMEMRTKRVRVTISAIQFKAVELYQLMNYLLLAGDG